MCPVCLSKQYRFFMKHRNKVDFPEEMTISETEYLASCDQCGTIFRLPLPDNAEELGKRYYDQMHNKQGFAETVNAHITHSQIPNYDSLLKHFKERFDPEDYPRWLDVGSGGYVTTTEPYDFDTIEPDYRVVSIGKMRFGVDKIQCKYVEEFKTKKPFDGVLFLNSFYCLPTPNEALDSVYDLLAPSGVLVIGIGSFLMGTRSTAEDGEYSRIGDILRGDSHWVYYNYFSLKHICLRHGFKHVDSSMLDIKDRQRTIRLFVFEKID